MLFFRFSAQLSTLSTPFHYVSRALQKPSITKERKQDFFKEFQIKTLASNTWSKAEKKADDVLKKKIHSHDQNSIQKFITAEKEHESHDENIIVAQANTNASFEQAVRRDGIFFFRPVPESGRNL